MNTKVLRVIFLILALFLAHLFLHNHAHAMPVAMQKMVCYPMDVTIINSYDTEEIIKKSQVVYTNTKHESDMTLYRCVMNNNEICAMRLEYNMELKALSCFKGN